MDRKECTEALLSLAVAITWASIKIVQTGTYAGLKQRNGGIGIEAGLGPE